MKLSKKVGIGAAALVVAAISVASWKLASGPSQGDDQPKPNASAVVIESPKEVKTGQLVCLDVRSSKATSFSWMVVPKTDNFMVIDDGKRAVFSHGAAGEFMFIVAAAHGDSVDVKTHTIKVSGPTVPQPTDELDAKVAEWCQEVKSRSKRDETLKLAQSFSSVAAMISAKVVTDPADITEATKNSNRDALGNRVNAWMPFLENLQKELQVQAKAGDLTDAESHAQFWRKISEGLLKYAESL